MSNLEIRNIPSANLSDKDKTQWNLYGVRASKNGYYLYYYLLTLSAMDWSTKTYYISDKYWTKKEAATQIGCDPRTITNNLKLLCNKGLLKRDDARKAYQFSKLEYWVPIHWDILKLFMKLGDEINWITMLRTYSVLGYAYQHNCQSFTVTDIISTLGVRPSSADFIRLILDWFLVRGLINFEREVISDPRYGNYYRYKLYSVELNSSQRIQELLTIEAGPMSKDWSTKFSLVASDCE